MLSDGGGVGQGQPHAIIAEDTGSCKNTGVVPNEEDKSWGGRGELVAAVTSKEN